MTTARTDRMLLESAMPTSDSAITEHIVGQDRRELLGRSVWGTFHIAQLRMPYRHNGSSITRTVPALLAADPSVRRPNHASDSEEDQGRRRSGHPIQRPETTSGVTRMGNTARLGTELKRRPVIWVERMHGLHFQCWPFTRRQIITGTAA